MYLHLGQDTVITTKSIIGIFDMDRCTVSKKTRDYLTEAEKKGLEVVAAKAFTADNKTDFSVQLAKAQEAGAELVFLYKRNKEGTYKILQSEIN